MIFSGDFESGNMNGWSDWMPDQKPTVEIREPEYGAIIQ